MAKNKKPESVIINVNGNNNIIIIGNDGCDKGKISKKKNCHFKNLKALVKLISKFINFFVILTDLILNFV